MTITCVSRQVPISKPAETKQGLGLHLLRPAEKGTVPGPFRCHLSAPPVPIPEKHEPLRLYGTRPQRLA